MACWGSGICRAQTGKASPWFLVTNHIMTSPARSPACCSSPARHNQLSWQRKHTTCEGCGVCQAPTPRASSQCPWAGPCSSSRGSSGRCAHTFGRLEAVKGPMAPSHQRFVWGDCSSRNHTRGPIRAHAIASTNVPTSQQLAPPSARGGKRTHCWGRR